MALYSTLYEKFAALQKNPLEGARLIYPSGAPSMLLADDIADCIVGIPAVREENGSLLYGPFVLPDDDFGRYASSRLIIASTSLLGAKTSITWRHRESLRKWVSRKQDPLRASYVAMVIFDELARQRIRNIMGEKFYQDIIMPADMLSISLLPTNLASLPVFSQAMLARAVLGAPSIHVSSAFREKIQDFVTALKKAKQSKDWEFVGDMLYGIVEKFPGRWHSLYLPYSEILPAAGREHIEIFRTGEIDQMVFRKSMRVQRNPVNLQDDAIGEEIYFQISRERQRNAKILSRLESSSKSLNIEAFGFPSSDYAGYHRLYGELAPQIRRMIEHARIVRNVLDESTFEESGNVDLQIAIQAVASETVRTDMFVRDENLLKNESWAILVDSSLSLGGIAKHLRSIALCVAETAKDIIGQNPWGMFAFSDDFLCIKDFSEPYDSLTKSRIGGLVPDGLSHIPDALRLARNLLLEHAKDRNYVILVSDGLPSGYSGIEKEMAGAVKEMYSRGVTLAAIGVGSTKIKNSIANARIINEPAEMARAFSEVYFALSS